MHSRKQEEHHLKLPDSKKLKTFFWHYLTETRLDKTKLQSLHYQSVNNVLSRTSVQIERISNIQKVRGKMKMLHKLTS